MLSSVIAGEVAWVTMIQLIVFLFRSMKVLEPIWLATLGGGAWDATLELRRPRSLRLPSSSIVPTEDCSVDFGVMTKA